jgi:hypothetical protein
MQLQYRGIAYSAAPQAAPSEIIVPASFKMQYRSIAIPPQTPSLLHSHLTELSAYAATLRYRGIAYSAAV